MEKTKNKMTNLLQEVIALIKTVHTFANENTEADLYEEQVNELAKIENKRMWNMVFHHTSRVRTAENVGFYYTKYDYKI